MRKIFLYELKNNIRPFIIWAFVIFLLLLLGAVEYPFVLKSPEVMMQMSELLPKAMRAAFGMNTIPVTNLYGYYGCMFLWCEMIVFAHAVILGSTIIAKEERNRTSEFLFTKPYSRRQIITAKILSAVIIVFAIAVIIYLSNAIFIYQIAPDSDIQGIIFKTSLGLFLAQLVYLATGLFLSAITKSVKSATTIGALFLLYSYIASILIETYDLFYLSFLSPFRYFDAATIILNGVNVFHIFVAVFIIIIFTYFTYLFYGRKDLYI